MYDINYDVIWVRCAGGARCFNFPTTADLKHIFPQDEIGDLVANLRGDNVGINFQIVSSSEYLIPGVANCVPTALGLIHPARQS